MRRLSPAMVANSNGTTARAISVSCQSRRTMTTSMPPRSTIDVRMGKKPFIVSVWMASVSAVRR
jgi:hypothetical protein